ncbi:MAG: serine/threonine protein kinase [Gemmatimonadetes bacterium]|nr:serine/threonine protein kinase [Gemmatimonadota bacterium]
MDRERWSRARALFDRAVELPPEERDAFVLRETATDPALRREVHALLEADAHVPTAFMEDGPRELSGALRAERDWSRIRFGPYRARSELGRGGTAVVLLGERADGRYRGDVAIKVLQTPWIAEGLSRRFQAEARILAELSHPNVARIYDAGETEEGLSYLIMEYVDGPRIDAWADDRRLGVPDRLRLFQKALDGVDYAHARGVIHRDLKPSNILVTQEGQPKLVDFGIAKLLGGQEALEPTVALTRTLGRMLTPEYASPEQFRGDPVDARTDVYSLGVVLYRLLTGRAPYDLSTTTPQAAERIICEQAPTLPSSAVTKPLALVPSGTELAETSPEILARNRASTLDRLQRMLKGDLDTIVLKALGKEPAERYATAGALNDDVQRYLEGRPIRARPPSLVYRARKFAQRRRTALAVATTVLIALGVAGWQARQAWVERANASARSQELVALVESVVNSVNLAERQATGDTQAREAAVRAALGSLQQLVDQMPGEPGADLLYRLSAAYREVAMVQGYPYIENLGRLEEGFASMRQAEALVRRITEEYPQHENAPAALGQQVGILGDFHMGAGRADSALVYFRESAELLTARVEQVPDDLAAIDGLAAILQRIGSWYFNARQLDSAAVYMERALEAERAYLSTTTRGDELSALQDIAGVTANLGVILAANGDLEGAIAREREALALSDSLAAADSDTPLTRRGQVFRRYVLSVHLAEAEQTEESRRLAGEAVELARALAEADATNAQAREDLAIALTNAASIEWRSRSPTSGLDLAREALTHAEASAGDRFALVAPVLATAHRMAGESLVDLGRPDAAATALRASQAVTRRYLDELPNGSDAMRREWLAVHAALARHYRASGDCARAVQLADSAQTLATELRERGAFTRGDERTWTAYQERMAETGRCGR